MNGSAILQTETRTGPTAQTRNRRVIEIAPISQKAPIYRKYVKRREKTETIKCPGTNILIVPDHRKINEVEKAGIVSTEPTMIGVLMINYSSK